jgi:hypothetical protein
MSLTLQVNALNPKMVSAFYLSTNSKIYLPYLEKDFCGRLSTASNDGRLRLRNARLWFELIWKVLRSFSVDFRPALFRRKQAKLSGCQLGRHPGLR